MWRWGEAAGVVKAARGGGAALVGLYAAVPWARALLHHRIHDCFVSYTHWHHHEVMVQALGFRGHEMAWKTAMTVACILKLELPLRE